MIPFITWKDQNLLLTVIVQTKSSKDEIIVTDQSTIKIKITAPPIDNAANNHLIKFLAKTFRVTQAQVTILKGTKSKKKLICINKPKNIPPFIVTIHTSLRGCYKQSKQSG